MIEYHRVPAVLVTLSYEHKHATDRAAYENGSAFLTLWRLGGQGQGPGRLGLVRTPLLLGSLLTDLSQRKGGGEGASLGLYY